MQQCGKSKSWVTWTHGKNIGSIPGLWESLSYPSKHLFLVFNINSFPSSFFISEVSLSHTTELGHRFGINCITGLWWVICPLLCSLPLGSEIQNSNRGSGRLLPPWEFMCFYISFVYLNHCIPPTSYLSHFQALEKTYTAYTLYITKKSNCTNILLDLQLYLFMTFHKADR